MTNFKSEDGKSSLELIKTDCVDEPGGKTYRFTCTASSRGFVARVSELWFCREDLLEFDKKIKNMISNFSIKAKVELQAGLEFSCMVEPQDYLGHFELTLKFEDLFYKNSATIIVELETQTLLNLSEELKSIAS